ncbi:hypothetical protein CHS0354_030022 [Potamilus streckersoni]|uniref:Uncharacterized protein n=1 Tax=Potamilus streckersoni TaxID=2493646 RepID=A0AAE0VTT3_9BIVA|nr:hypothetical protein CHS0354_030022 [Potamilus streckersoni]
MWIPCTELAILFFLMNNTADAEVNIPDITPTHNGDTVNLTCIISPFTLPAVWKNNDSGVHITTCLNTGTCSPSSEGVQYGFSATSSSITVMISSFNSTTDTFTWRCEHSGIVAVYRIMVATTRESTMQSTITRMAANTESTATQQRPCHLFLLLETVFLVLYSLFQS